MRLTLVKVPGLLAPARSRQHHVGELRGLGEEQVLHDHEQVVLREDLADPRQLRHRHRRVGRGDPQELDRALLGVAEDLHRVGRRRPVRDRQSGRRSTARRARSTWSGLSQLRKPGRSPSAPHSRLFCAVGWPFICRMPQPGRPIMPAQQVQVVDLARTPRWPGATGRSPAAPWTARASLVAEDPRGRARMSSAVDAADLGDRAPACTARPSRRSSSKPRVCAATQSSSTQPLTNSSRIRPFISARLVPGRRRQVHAAGALGLVGDRGAARVDARRASAGPAPASPVQDRAPTARSGSRPCCARTGRSRRSGRCRCSSRAGRRRRSDSFIAAAAVAVHSRVLPSMCGVPMPALPITASV